MPSFRSRVLLVSKSSVKLSDQENRMFSPFKSGFLGGVVFSSSFLLDVISLFSFVDVNAAFLARSQIRSSKEAKKI